MKFMTLTAGPNDDGRRADVVLRKLLPGDVGLSGLYGAMRKGLVRVNGQKVAPDTRICQGDEVSIVRGIALRSARKAAIQRARVIDILFRNNDICVIDKPKGLSSQSDELRAFLAVETDSLSFVAAPVHRLDRDTTGCLACSQSIDGARWFSAALKNQRIEKTYLGIAQGIVEKEERWIDQLAASTALSVVTPLAWGPESTLVRYELHTGKKHQLRRQSALRGYPLAGDEKYGGGEGGFFLHAWHLGFPRDNPLGLPADIVAPIPQAFIEKLGEYAIPWEDTE